MRDALEASGAEMVTVALRRVDLSGKKDPFANILEFIDPEKFLLPQMEKPYSMEICLAEQGPSYLISLLTVWHSSM